MTFCLIAIEFIIINKIVYMFVVCHDKKFMTAIFISPFQTSI